VRVYSQHHRRNMKRYEVTLGTLDRAPTLLSMSFRFLAKREEKNLLLTTHFFLGKYFFSIDATIA
jgi:hypothetical protein